jgi:hypothetical protein
MRKLASILTFVLLFQISKGQDTIKRFEFGSTLVTTNLFSNDPFVPESPSFQFINGLFFRYSKNRLAFRVHTSYSDNSSSDSYQSIDWPATQSHYRNNKDFRIGVGSQFSILKNKDWLYSFLDFSYRNIYSSGHNDGSIPTKYWATVNGVDCFLGFGLKIKTLKNVYISPEMGYYSSSQFVNKTTTFTYDYYFGEPTKYNFSYSETHFNPALKIHLTVKF